MKFTIIIPARMHSTRLSNKMMRLLGDIPLIEYTWRQALLAGAERVIVATDHEIIFNHLHHLGAEVLMTNSEHQNGTERLAEVVDTLQLSNEQIIVNWQGDEPFLPIALIHKAAHLLHHTPTASISTLATPITTLEAFNDPNIVKVVCDQQQRALYFSRAGIPFVREQQDRIINSTMGLRHIGLYVYRSHFLSCYSQLSESPYEKLEKLEQLRALHHGYAIAVAIVDQLLPAGVDTEADLIAAQLFMKNISHPPH